MSEIHSFTIYWYDQTMHALWDVSKHETTINRITQQVIHRLYSDVEEIPLREKTYEIEDALIESFFSYLSDTVKINEWKKDYRAFVEDGWAWEVLIRYSNRRSKKVRGTVEPPPFGEEIQAKIIKLANFEEKPYLFS